MKGIGGLALSNNNLTGPIPTEIGNLKGMGGLVLNNNNLTGSIPSEIGKLKGLSGLLLNNNCLSIDSDGIKAIKSLDVYNKGKICPYKDDPFWAFSCIDSDGNKYNFDNNCIEKGVLKGITKSNCDKCKNCGSCKPNEKGITSISIQDSSLIIKYA